MACESGWQYAQDGCAREWIYSWSDTSKIDFAVRVKTRGVVDARQLEVFQNRQLAAARTQEPGLSNRLMDSEWRKDDTPEGVVWFKIARRDARTTYRLTGTEASIRSKDVSGWRYSAQSDRRLP
ncbi:unnamed protein product [Phytophthora fragariaefolia]|uniref:Unnamed protein product n=1 Tax=Phytophthora fragariaefolia TaxID=1490495 RepID=A0A9W6TIN9_9STRA|nr:unnamed protein product [Phytophthora fragariaefolia]